MTTQKQTISVVVSAYNEEEKIKECLLSVKFADEIIVVDNQSSDNTAKIARLAGAIVISRPNNAMLNINKNFGFSKASSVWILNLDADERATPQLISEIKKKIGERNGTDGYWIPRKNIIFGKWIEHSIWWPDYQLRLFKNGKGKFAERHVHEPIEVHGKTEKLEESLIHINYTTVSQYLQKLDNIYTENEAEQFIAEGKTIHWVDAIRFPVNDFLKTFFLQKGYKEGLHGLVLSLLQAFYSLIVFAKVWEKQGFKEENSKTFLKDTYKEFEKAFSDITYWFLTVTLDETSQKGKKFFYKLRRKMIKRP